MVSEFEEKSKNRQFGRRINAQEEIAELKRTCDKIDEFFDFGPEKTQDRTIYDGATTEIIESPKPSDQNLHLAHLHFETPQFTRSPILVTPHAGLPVTEYRISEKEGPQKVIVHKNSRPPMALATSTPIGTIGTKKSRLVVQELASQRVLLICRERLKLQLDEIRRLQALAVVRHPPPPINRHFKSTMVISNISLQLNKNFHARGSFAFIVLFKCRTEVEASGVVTLLAHYQTRVHVIQFGEHIHFSNLPVDFVIGMEVYMMRVPEYKPPEKTCAAYLAEKVRNLLVPNAHRNRHNRTSVSLSLPAQHPPPQLEFKFCGKLTLDRDSAGDRNFLLDDVTYPLEGTVRLQSTCSSLPEAIDVEYRGFLFLFHEQNVSPIMSKGATWHRYWAMLHRGVIFFWKNPLDEKNEQIPISQIDLTKCTNQSIEETQTKTAAQHEFHIELLIDQTPSLLEKRRVVLAAESSDHLVSWLNAINDTLYILRSQDS